MSMTNRDQLACEARVLARYLLGEEPTAEAVERYIAANLRNMPAATSGFDERCLQWAIGRPMLLGPLDAALAFCGVETPLRHKLVLMSAILETCPEYAGHFDRPVPSRFGLVGIFTAIALEGAGMLLVGLPLLVFLRRTA